MKIVMISFMLILFGTQPCFAEKASFKKEVIDISKFKWQWMADKETAKLEQLFHEDSKFVHMGGTWKKKEELDIIASGKIWYKKVDVQDVAAEVFGNTAIVWSRITLEAEVGGKNVSNQFTATEVYQKQSGDWKMLDLTFSAVMDAHKIAH